MILNIIYNKLSQNMANNRVLYVTWINIIKYPLRMQQAVHSCSFPAIHVKERYV
jgi:hypothetical protein